MVIDYIRFKPVEVMGHKRLDKSEALPSGSRFCRHRRYLGSLCFLKHDLNLAVILFLFPILETKIGNMMNYFKQQIALLFTQKLFLGAICCK